MSNTTQKIPLKPASDLAYRISVALRPGCERIQIAGSLRRECDMIGDIDIVAIPRMVKRTNPQGSFLEDYYSDDEISKLDIVLDELLKAKPHFTRVKGGESLKTFNLTYGDNQVISINLFITSAVQWGYILAIRTGPAEFSRRLVLSQSHGGHLPPEYICKGGYVWRKAEIEAENEIVPLYEEHDFFALLGIDYILPEHRDKPVIF